VTATAIPPAAAPRRVSGRQWRLLAGLCAVATMTTIDSTVVNVALPSIKSDFHAHLSSLQWVVTGYTLVFAMFMVPAGRVADVIGRDRIWACGAGLFALASVACGLAPNEETLIAGRVVQGLGAAAMKPATVAMVVAAFPSDRRGWALGVMGSALAGAAAAGPVLGGLITATLGWRLIFFINVPIAVVAVAAVWRARTETERRDAPETIDVSGAALLGASLLLLMLALVQGSQLGLRTGLVLAAAAVAVGAAFVMFELRRSSPIMELRLLRRPAYLAGNAISVMASIGFFGMLFLQSLYLQGVLRHSILVAGALLVPLGLSTLVTSRFGGRLADRMGAWYPIAGGLALMGVALLLLSQATPDSSYATHLLPAYVLEGAGWGFVSAPLNAAVIGAAGTARSGEAAGVLSTFDKFGSALGVGLASAVFDVSVRSQLSERLTAAAIPATPDRIDDLHRLLGGPDAGDRIGGLFPGGRAEALAIADAAFAHAFQLVMLGGAAVFALAVATALFSLAHQRRIDRHDS
jgi:EmrB/QacA subfamily drug resistance transporter